MQGKNWNVVFTCVRAGLHVGLVSSFGTTNSLFGQHLKYWFIMISVTTCDECHFVWPYVTNDTTSDKVTTCDNVTTYDYVTACDNVTTFDKCDHMWQVWSLVTSVTTCDKCDNMDVDIWTSWTFGHHWHLDIIDIWTSWIFGHHRHLDIMDIWT